MKKLRYGQRALRSGCRVLHRHLSSSCLLPPSLPPATVCYGVRRQLSTDSHGDGAPDTLPTRPEAEPLPTKALVQPRASPAEQVEVLAIPWGIRKSPLPLAHFEKPELKALNGLALNDATTRVLEALGARNPFNAEQTRQLEALRKSLELRVDQDGRGGDGSGGGGVLATTTQAPISGGRTFLRTVPVSASYFSRQASFNDAFVALHLASVAHAHLPRVSSADAERASWRSPKEWRLEYGEHVRAPDYSQAMELVRSLHRIHPRLKTTEIDQALHPFRRAIGDAADEIDPGTVDEYGRSVGIGRRKSSVATAWLVEGTGEIQVNGKSLADAFGRVHDRESVVWALHASRRLDKYNLWARVYGGGTTGQAEALTLAVAKALLVHEPGLKAALRRAGVVTRDWRRVERKKPGRVKARKRPTWVKR